MRVWHTHSLLACQGLCPQPPKGGKGSRASPRNWTRALKQSLTGQRTRPQEINNNAFRPSFSALRETLHDDPSGWGASYEWENGFVGPETVNAKYRGSAAIAVLSPRATARRMVTAPKRRGGSSSSSTIASLPPIRSRATSQREFDLAMGIVQKQLARERTHEQVLANRSWVNTRASRNLC